MASGTSASMRSSSFVIMAFSLMRGIMAPFCMFSDSAMRSRMSATDSKPMVSFAHSSVTSGAAFFFTTVQVTSKFTGLPAWSAKSTAVSSAGTSRVNSLVWPFFMPMISASKASDSMPVPGPYRRDSLVMAAMSLPSASVALMARSA